VKRDRTEPSYVRTLGEAGYTLIPLREPGATDVEGRSRGKSPRDTDWTRRDYTGFDAAEHMKRGGNVGVRLTGEQLVVDVDPRNFLPGDDPLERLCRDTGLDAASCPRVRTGSGGQHLYLRLPAGVKLRDTLGEYPGVEFKSAGRQVVAPGSVHPETGRCYYWEAASPHPSTAPDAPDKLVTLARRPSRPASAGGGEYDQAEVAAMLDALRPEDFRDHDRWFRLMAACHHASAGEARGEFVEWSTRDPKYAADAAVIGRRWDSLHGLAAGPSVTYRTLTGLLREAGREDAIPRTPAKDDFEAVDETESPPAAGDPPTAERKGPLERLNDKYWAVLRGGKFAIMWEEVDPSARPPRKMWLSCGPADFRAFMANRHVVRGKKTVPLADAWLEWPRRRTAQGVVFDPERDHEGFLNLWTGWAAEPKRGDWSALRDLLGEALCDGDTTLFEYVMDWAAHMVQRPWEMAEVALCFQGEKGTGKGTFARYLCALAGRHGLHISSSDQLSGRFNAHLRDLIFLFADEALRPGDKAAESRLKALLTEPMLAFEGKGRDVESGRNFVRVVMATNEDWVVPMGAAGEERRFVVQRANSSWKGKAERFRRVDEQMKAGGTGGLLWDLMQRDITGWHPRDSMPRTRAGAEQRVRNLGVVATWWMSVLEEGSTPGSEGWETRVLKEDLKAHFARWCRGSGINPGAMGRGLDMLFAKDLRKVCPESNAKVRMPVPADRADVTARHGDGRAWGYEFPGLARCRELMEAVVGEVEWPAITGPVD
jgi:hypothetical protein